MKVYVINEHPDWLSPLGRALDAIGVPWAEHFVDTGPLGVDSAAPAGVYFNRMSASSHTRGHHSSVDHARDLVGVLESQGRRVLNGTRAMLLEMSKVRQHAALRACGFDTPRTVAVYGGPEEILRVGEGLWRRTGGERVEWAHAGAGFILKPNRGGKGAGVRLIRGGLDELRAVVGEPGFATSPDRVTLLQEYIVPAEPVITRVELVGGRFVYAIRSSTAGGFDLCPADGCGPCSTEARFALRRQFERDPIVARYERFAREQGVDVCGIEFIEDRAGRRYTYDINGTTNYNPAVEQEHGSGASAALAELLGRELAGAGWDGRQGRRAGVAAAGVV